MYKRILVTALFLLGVGIFTYGATTTYELASEKPYHYTVSDTNETEAQNHTIAEFDGLSEPEQDAFLSMHDGGTYPTEQDTSPVEADVVRYEGEMFRVYLSEVREPATLLQYLFSVVAVIGLVFIAVGIRIFERLE